MGVMLAALMLLSVVTPVQFSAATDREIIYAVDITGMIEPKVGEKPVLSVDENEKFTVESVYFTNKTDRLEVKENDTFKVGKVYTGGALITAKENYRFKTTDSGACGVVATVNGKAAAANVVYNEDPATKIAVIFEFPALEDSVENKNITELNITGIKAPKVDEEIYMRADNGTGYSVESVGWYNKTDGYFLLEKDKFSADKVYTARIKVKAVDGYVFDNPTATVNGFAAKVSAIDGYKPAEYLLITYDFKDTVIQTPVETDSTEPSTQEPTETVTVEQPTTEPVTEPEPTQPVTTQPATEAPTEAVEPTEPATTEPATTQPVTDAPTEAVKPTQPATKLPVIDAAPARVSAKKANPIKVTVKTKTVKLKKLKKKDQKISAITVKNAKGKVSYKITGVQKKIGKLVKINSKGVITFKKWKAAKKGTYRIKVAVSAAGNKSYKPKKIIKEVKIIVK